MVRTLLRIVLAQFRQCRREPVAGHFRAAPAAGWLTVRDTRLGQRLHDAGHTLGQGHKLRHKPSINPVLPAPDPITGGRERPAFRHCTLCSQRQQGEKTPLWPVAAQGTLQQRVAQVRGQHRCLPDRIHAGFGPRVLQLRGDISRGKNGGVIDRLQGVAHREETALDGAQATGPDPGRRRRTGTPEQRVKCRSAAVFQCQLCRRDAIHPAAAQHADARRRQCPPGRGPGVAIVAGQYVGGRAKQAELRCLRTQAVRHGQRQLHAAGATAHQGNVRCPPIASPQQRGFKCLPASPEVRHGLDRCRMLPGAGHAVEVGLGADVQTQHVVAQDGTPGDAELARRRVQSRHRRLDKARSRPLAEPREVDMGLVEGVVARDQPRQHARIGCVAGGGHQGDAQAGERTHGEHSQRQRMCMTATHQHQVTLHRLHGQQDSALRA